MPRLPLPRRAVAVSALLTGPFLLAVAVTPVDLAANPAPISAADTPTDPSRTTSSPNAANSTPPSVAPSAAPSGQVADSRARPRAGPFVWPLAPPHPVVRPFHAPETPYGPGHRGVDLGGDIGEPVLAAADGVVVFAGQMVNRGVVSVDHANGLRTTYEPVSPAVKAGQRVTAGSVLGHLQAGHAGCAGAPACLHWGVRRGEEYLNPLALLSLGRIRLLPWKED